MRKLCLLLLFAWAGWVISACDVLRSIVPLPEPTASPTPTAILPTPTPFPTLGQLEYIDAAYCLDPVINQIQDEDELNFLRFFPSGVVLDFNVANHGGCAGTWEYIAPYVEETATDIFSHGRYELSGSAIRFTLAPPGSDVISGTVMGRYEGETLILQKQGAEMTYILIFVGGQP